LPTAVGGGLVYNFNVFLGKTCFSKPRKEVIGSPVAAPRRGAFVAKAGRQQRAVALNVGLRPTATGAVVLIMIQTGLTGKTGLRR